MATVARSVSVGAYESVSNPARESWTSSVSWGAVIAGAFISAALSLILLALGAGMGLSAISPWMHGEPSSAVGKVAIVWLICAQLIASGVGGYLTGRLRTRWVDVHTHEVYFRDTAHGFLAWCVCLVVTAAFLASAAAAIAGVGTVNEGATAHADPGGYYADALLRSTTHANDGSDAATRSEAAVILAHAAAQGSLAASDRAYLGEMVVAHTGLTQGEAERRVLDTFSAEQEALETARKAAAHSLYWTFLALLIGAFTASFAATIGGRERDQILPAA